MKEQTQAKILISNQLLNQYPQIECLNMKGCHCPVCMIKINTQINKNEALQKQNNGLEQFLKQFPTNFPLFINPTTVYRPQSNHHLHYSNGNKVQNKSFIYKTKVSKLLTNFPIAHNIHIYGNNFSKLRAKHETMSFIKRLQQNPFQLSSSKFESQFIRLIKCSQQNPEEPNASNLSNKTSKNNIDKKNGKNLKQNHKESLVISPNNNQSKQQKLEPTYYSMEIPIKVLYLKKNIAFKLDTLLVEYLDEEEKHFELQKPYQINQQFWQWVYSQYGEEIFALFATEFYCRVYQFATKNVIHEAVFYWVFQKAKSEFGDNTKITEELGKHKWALEAQYFIAKIKRLNFKVKLMNIKNLKIEYYQNLKSFQEQYQQLILQRIKTQSSPKLTKVGSASDSSNKKKYIYQNRLDSFQTKVRDLFLSQQNRVLNQVQKQKQFDGKEDSTKLAKLLLPNMGQHQTIRQILNDQFAFQKLILFQERKKQKERLKRARENLLSQNRGKDNTNKHSYQQSRIKKKQFNCRRIRLKTDFY